MLLRVLHHSVQGLVKFGVHWSYDGESGASSRSQAGISETLPMMMVTIWCALVLWWGLERGELECS